MKPQMQKKYFDLLYASILCYVNLMEMIPHYLKDVNIEKDEREASPGDKPRHDSLISQVPVSSGLGFAHQQA